MLQAETEDLYGHLPRAARNLFDIGRLREDVGWAPEYCFRAAVEQTWEWMRREGLDRTLEFDFTAEDALLATLASRGSSPAASV